MNNWILIYNSSNTILNTTVFENNQYQKMKCGDTCAYYKRDGRFVNDQLFFSSDQELIISDGVILNLCELKRKYQANDLMQVIRCITEVSGENYFTDFIGPFTGLHYSLKDNSLVAYGNQTGDAPIFYYTSKNFNMVSIDLNLIVDVLVENNITYTFDEMAALYVMTFGYMIDNRTMISEIKRLSPGKYLYFKDSIIEIKEYHSFIFEDKERTFDEAIELVDSGFRKAIKRCFDKDIEYGYQEHLADMSGGLDSRMTNWVARDMGYNNVVNINYCQSSSNELRCASGASAFLGNQFFHKQLDDASFIYNVDQIVNMNYGLAVFCGITGGEQMLRSLNGSRFGLEHSGQLGDGSVGTYYHDNGTKRTFPQIASIRYSSLIDCCIPQAVLAELYEHEKFSVYTRAFLGMFSSHLIRRHYFYTVSPFLDINFLDVIYKIPISMRAGNRLYWAWIDKKYPEAGKLPSTRLRQGEAFEVFFSRAYRRVKRDIRKLGYRFGFAESSTDPNNMNPFDYWYETKPELREFIHSYYLTNRPLLTPYQQTADNVDKLYSSFKTMDKMLTMTVLGVMKRYFSLSKNK